MSRWVETMMPPNENFRLEKKNLKFETLDIIIYSRLERLKRIKCTIKSTEKANLKDRREEESWFGRRTCVTGSCVWLLVLKAVLLFVEPSKGSCWGKVLRFIVQPHPLSSVSWTSCPLHLVTRSDKLTSFRGPATTRPTQDMFTSLHGSATMLRAPPTHGGHSLKSRTKTSPSCLKLLLLRY